MWLLCLRFYLTSVAEPQGHCTWCTVKSLAPITIIANKFTCPLEFLNDVYGTTCLTKHTRNRFLCRRAQQVADFVFFSFLQGGTNLHVSRVCQLHGSKYNAKGDRETFCCGQFFSRFLFCLGDTSTISMNKVKISHPLLHVLDLYKWSIIDSSPNSNFGRTGKLLFPKWGVLAIPWHWFQINKQWQIYATTVRNWLYAKPLARYSY